MVDATREGEDLVLRVRAPVGQRFTNVYVSILLGFVPGGIGLMFGGDRLGLILLCVAEAVAVLFCLYLVLGWQEVRLGATTLATRARPLPWSRASAVPRQRITRIRSGRTGEHGDGASCLEIECGSEAPVQWCFELVDDSTAYDDVARALEHAYGRQSR